MNRIPMPPPTPLTHYQVDFGIIHPTRDPRQDGILELAAAPEGEQNEIFLRKFTWVFPKIVGFSVQIIH